jgi:large subunit ribosomal protein L27
MSKRLGVKIYGGQAAQAGQVIIRQRGSRYRAGANVRMGGDDTLYAAKNGIVRFYRRQVQRFTGTRKDATFVSIQ